MLFPANTSCHILQMDEEDTQPCKVILVVQFFLLTCPFAVHGCALISGLSACSIGGSCYEIYAG